MENKRLGQRVKELRLQRGFSQELLSEKTNLNLRTVQRIESGTTIPRGDTLTRLSEALQVSPDELIDWKKQTDKGFLSLINMSSLTFVLMPLLGIIVPLALWVSKREKIEKVDEFGKTILNFQISLLIIFPLIFFLNGVGCLLLKIFSNSAFIDWFGPFIIFYIPVGFYYLFNSLLIIINIKRVHNDKPLKYYPLIKIIK